MTAVVKKPRKTDKKRPGNARRSLPSQEQQMQIQHRAKREARIQEQLAAKKRKADAAQARQLAMEEQAREKRRRNTSKSLEDYGVEFTDHSDLITLRVNDKDEPKSNTAATSKSDDDSNGNISGAGGGDDDEDDDDNNVQNSMRGRATLTPQSFDADYIQIVNKILGSTISSLQSSAPKPMVHSKKPSKNADKSPQPSSTSAAATPGLQLIIVSSSAERTLEILKLLKSLSPAIRVSKLFARHLKLADQITQLNSHQFLLGVGTPNRIAKLLLDESAQSALSKLQHIVFDQSWRDLKKRQLFDTADEDLASIIAVAVKSKLNLHAV